jgi:hypothetical protein
MNPTLEQFKKELGETGKRMTDGQLRNLMTFYDHLAESWLEKKEVEVFGKTVRELTQL